MIGLWDRLRARIPLAAKIHHRALYNWLKGEPELRLLKHVCDPSRAAVDVGANLGIYTYFLRRHSRRCYAVEPNPELVDVLRRSFGDSIDILAVALSDRPGPVGMRLPTIDGRADHGRATIEDANVLDGHSRSAIAVEARRLDDLDFDPVGFIKIDVEGHEMAVLRGGRALLERDRPALLVESEERHRTGAVGDLFSFLGGFGYRGFFRLEGGLRPISRFDLGRHQRPENVGDHGIVKGRVYVNNFLFLPEGPGRDPLLARLGLDEAR